MESLCLQVSEKSNYSQLKYKSQTPTTLTHYEKDLFECLVQNLDLHSNYTRKLTTKCRVKVTTRLEEKFSTETPTQRGNHPPSSAIARPLGEFVTRTCINPVTPLL